MLLYVMQIYLFLRQGLCSSSCSRTCYVDQAGLEITEPSASASASLLSAGIKSVSHHAGSVCRFYKYHIMGHYYMYKHFISSL